MQAAATGRLSGAERSHPTSEVRGRSQEVHMHEGQRPRGVTPRPRSGAAAKSTRLRRHRNGREELPRVRGQAGQAKGVTPRPRSGAAMRGVSYPASEVSGGGREEDTQRPRSGMVTRGATPRPHARGKGRWPGGPTPCPRSSGCVGTEGPRGAIPR